jgi:hypothetical protein
MCGSQSHMLVLELNMRPIYNTNCTFQMGQEMSSSNLAFSVIKTGASI